MDIEYYYINDTNKYTSERFDNIINYNNIKELYCLNNNLTHLPNLPNSLITLYCFVNNLTYLKKIHTNLKTFYYMCNFIKFIKLINKLHTNIPLIKTTYYYENIK